MLKKVALVIATGSLVFAAQAATADDTQFEVSGRYQGVSALPFATSPAQSMADRTAETPKATERARVSPMPAGPAPYGVAGGYQFS